MKRVPWCPWRLGGDTGSWVGPQNSKLKIQNSKFQNGWVVPSAPSSPAAARRLLLLLNDPEVAMPPLLNLLTAPAR